MGFFFTLVYLALSLIRPGEMFPPLARFHVMEVAAAAAAITTVLSLLGESRPSFRSPQLYLAAAFVAWAGFSVLLAQRWLGGALDALQGLGTNCFLFLLLTLNVGSLRRLEWARRILILLALWQVFLGTAAYFLHYGEATFVLRDKGGEDGDEPEEDTADEAIAPDAAPPELPDGSERPVPAPVSVVRRIRGLGLLHDPNDLAQALAAILPLVFLGWRSRRPLHNVLIVLVPAVLILGGIALTRSRGGLVALVAMALAAIVYFGRRAVAAFSLAASGAGLIAGVAVVRAYVDGDESSFGRVAAWSEGLNMVRSSPLWGVGYGGFTDYSALVAHNSFLHCFAELGAVGYFLWLGMIVVTFHELFVLRRTVTTDDADPLAGELRRWTASTALALFGFLAGAFFLSRSYSATLFLFLALPTALADIARRSGRTVAPFSPLLWFLVIVALQVATLVGIYGIVKVMR